MHNVEERDAYEARFKSFKGVDGDWAKKPEVSEHDWKQLQKEHAAHRAKYRRIAAQHAEWQVAVKLADAARFDGAVASQKRQQLRDRYVSPRRPNVSASDPFDDAED